MVDIVHQCNHGRIAGLEIKIFSREPNCIFKSHLQVLYIETSTFLGSLQKFEGAAGEFKGALSSRHPLNSSPGLSFSSFSSPGAIYTMFHMQQWDTNIIAYLSPTLYDASCWELRNIWVSTLDRRKEGRIFLRRFKQLRSYHQSGCMVLASRAFGCLFGHPNP